MRGSPAVETDYVIEIGTDLTAMADVRQFIQEKADALGVDPQVVPDMLLAVTEVATNVVVHGYRDEEGRIEIKVMREGDALVVRLRDEAPAFDPASIAQPDLSLPLEERPAGGMGIFLTYEVMDEVKHRVLPEGGNELILVKAP